MANVAKQYTVLVVASKKKKERFQSIVYTTITVSSSLRQMNRQQYLVWAPAPFKDMKCNTGA